MALTMGLASVGHLDHVWAVLEQFGQSKPVKWSLDGLSTKVWGKSPRAGDRMGGGASCAGPEVWHVRLGAWPDPWWGGKRWGQRHGG